MASTAAEQRTPLHAALDTVEAIDEPAGTAERHEPARGIHSVVLMKSEREPALAGITLALLERSPAHVQETAYIIGAEAPSNATQHARATRAAGLIARRGAALLVRLGDDVRGGAALDRGSGRRRLSDGVAGLRDAFAVESPSGGGTTVRGELPCAS
jgi:signal transduction histidine kinase